MAQLKAGSTVGGRDIATKNDNQALQAQLNDKGTVNPSDYATSTTGGTIKVRISGTDLYITTNGADA